MDFSIDKLQPLTLVTLNLLERHHSCFHGLGHPLPPHEGKGIPVELTDCTDRHNGHACLSQICAPCQRGIVHPDKCRLPIRLGSMVLPQTL